MFEHSSVEWLLYVCEACMLCLSPNVLKFFGKLLHSNDNPTQDLRIFWSCKLLLHFLCAK